MSPSGRYEGRRHCGNDHDLLILGFFRRLGGIVSGYFMEAIHQFHTYGTKTARSSRAFPMGVETRTVERAVL